MCSYYDGIVEGLTRYAWWKDGVQYVGTCGCTLKQAVADVEAERRQSVQEAEKTTSNAILTCPECGGKLFRFIDGPIRCEKCDYVKTSVGGN